MQTGDRREIDGARWCATSIAAMWPSRTRAAEPADTTPVQTDLPSALCERIVTFAHGDPNGVEILFRCVDVLDAARIDLQAAPLVVIAENPVDNLENDE